MSFALNLPSFSALFTLWITYYVFVAIHRLYFSPLAKFPGPKLAALTSWYEFYYDVILQGRYLWRIAEIHQEYGEW